MTTLLIVLSCVEAVLLVAVLVFFLTSFARRFRSAAAMLERAAGAPAGDEGDDIALGVRRLNAALEALRDDLADVAARAEEA